MAMSNNVQTTVDSLPVSKPSPLPGKPVLVQCEKFRCMARQDTNGKWKSVFGDTELTTFIKVIETIGG